MLIDGRKIAAGIYESLKVRPKPEKFLGAALVGEDPASLNFLKQKEKAAAEVGVEFRLYKLKPDITTDELRAEIGRLAGAKTCGGFLVQLPLAEEINQHYVLNAIPKDKDVDLLSEAGLGAFYTGRGKLVPPSAATVAEILSRSGIDLRRANVVLMGAGFLIGKPVGFWLQKRVAELTVLDKESVHLREKLKEADVVISGAGVAGLFSPADLKEGALVIDFGWNRKDGKTMGDFDPSAGSQPAQSYGGQAGHGPTAEEKNISYTPTPGGTGPILVAKLLQNFYDLNT